MPNHNYIAGRRTEYLVRNKMLENGFDEVARTAGSRSSADLIGIKKGNVYFIQCKRVKTETEAKRLGRKFTAMYEKSNDQFIRAIVIYVSEDRTYIQWSNGAGDII